MSEKLLGRLFSTAKEGTKIMPKKILGYKTPKPQVLKEDGQKIVFKYTPIKYDILYKLEGGEFPSSESVKDHYTIEEQYIPPKPVKEKANFKGWNPEKLPVGTVGRFTFTAVWEDYPILKTGKEINNLISGAFGKENIMAIQLAFSGPSNESVIDLSCTNSPIKAWLNNGTLFLNAKSQIHCNKDMEGAFEGFTVLRDISDLYDWECEEGTNIKSLFKDCKMLSDISGVSAWAHGKFSDFTDAFTGTIAMEAGRVPSWYRWNVMIHWMSSTGIILDEKMMEVIPKQVIYPKTIDGYYYKTTKIEINDPNIEYTFIYIPNEYDITYITHGGELFNPKTKYTIEDETYYPSEPVKPDCRFVGWEPACINHGEYGNVSFVAKYTNL